MTDRREAGEFEIIGRYFRPLAAGEPGALDLADDAALLDPIPGHSLVLTTDAAIAGIHFFPADPPDLVARKLLRRNLSDLAAMGAKPRVYLLSCALPKETGSEWFAAFAAGLAADQREFDIRLVGGGTGSTLGPAVLSITAVGDVPKGQALLRKGARPGDLVFVTGTIGDAAIGLRVLRGDVGGLDTASREALVERYRLPQPRVNVGIALRGIAHAAIDISDGLVGDLRHVCEVSNVGAVIDWSRIPCSPPSRKFLAAVPGARETVLAGGDDYELLFTAAAGDRGRIGAMAAQVNVPVTEIGYIEAGRDVVVRDESGNPIALEHFGYRHFDMGRP